MNSNDLYIKDISYVCNLDFPWERYCDKTIMISGASGLIGSFLIDVLMKMNEQGLNCKLLAVGRNRDHASKRFEKYWASDLFQFLSHDINVPIELDDTYTINYVFHLASNTHPVAYATDPIGTITTNIIGSSNLLELAAAHKTERFVFASSNEIYGENRGDQEFFDEDYCGYLNSNTLRAGYPESKRCGEALCQAYIKQKDLDIVIPRFTRTYGPTMIKSDTKAISQFLKKAVSGEDIVLKSAGTQYYSYTYVADAVAGLLTVFFFGTSGEVYNVADTHSDIRLKDLAALIADYTGTKVVFEIPDKVEKAGYSTATKARLSGEKLKRLGWNMKYNIKEGIERTIDILKCTDSIL